LFFASIDHWLSKHSLVSCPGTSGGKYFVSEPSRDRLTEKTERDEVPDNMIDKEMVTGFRAGLRGELLMPGDDGYDLARSVWNGMIDKRPALIAACTGVADVVASVNFARKTGLPVSVKGGGHGVSGKAICDDALLIDLTKMKSVRVDLAKGTARVGAGAKLGDLDHETQAFGLAVPAGIVSDTGVAGLTLGGGIGYQGRKHGLTVDNLVSADLVLADGSFAHISEDSHPDLFWAIRGGGGNFGVVTSFEYKLRELGPEVSVSLSYYDIEHGPEVLRYYRDFMSNAPNEVACYCLFVTVPPAPHLPEEYHGKPAVILHCCYAGPVEEGKEVLKPLSNFGSPFFSLFAPMKFTELQSAFDPGNPAGMRYYWKAANFDEISDAAVEVLSEQCRDLHGVFSLVGFEPLGGAINERKPFDTAYPHRSANFELGIWTGWQDPAEDEENIRWARALFEAMLPHAGAGVYSNYLDTDETERVGAAYGENLERLKEIKRKYDSENLFRSNMNIEPEAPK
jgi:FAD/FMN-containing dehydrogenase